MPAPSSSRLARAVFPVGVVLLLGASAQLGACRAKCSSECADGDSSGSSDSGSVGSSSEDTSDGSGASSEESASSEQSTNGAGDGDGDGADDLCAGGSDRCGCLNLAAAWCADFTEASSYDELADWCADRGGEVILDNCPSVDLSGACVLADDCYSPSYYFYEGYAGGLNGWADLSEAMAACSGCSIWEEP